MARFGRDSVLRVAADLDWEAGEMCQQVVITGVGREVLELGTEGTSLKAVLEGSADGYRIEVITQGGRRVEVIKEVMVPVRRGEKVVIRVSPREG